jgi:hypothetical protein
MDDVVVQVTDGHNLVGNPNFEAQVVDGWTVSGGTGALAVSNAFASGGAYSLAVSGRAAATAGPTYVLPLGAARYSVSFRALHNGTATHSLSLVPTYTCLGAPVTTGSAIVTSTAIGGGTWVTLSGTVTLPPASATAGCRLTQAAIVVQQEAGPCVAAAGGECPDLFVDDVSITLTP